MTTLVTRDQWGARRARAIRGMPLPAPDVWLHHTAGTEPDGPVGVRAVQNFHMAPKPDGRDYWDIAYSFVVDRRGVVYEGRGAGVQGAHTSGHNSTSHAICVLGNYDRDPVPPAVVGAVAALLRHGHGQGWWPAPQLAGGHRDVGSTSCPGTYLYRLVDDINRQASADVPEEDIMRQGDNGARVAAWQHRIDQLPGVDCTVDGDFGPKTVAATKQAQKLLGLPEDGEVHPAEWALLVSTLSGRDLSRHADTPHAAEVDLSGLAKKRHSHEGTVTLS